MSYLTCGCLVAGLLCKNYQRMNTFNKLKRTTESRKPISGSLFDPRAEIYQFWLEPGALTIRNVLCSADSSACSVSEGLVHGVPFWGLWSSTSIVFFSVFPGVSCISAVSSKCIFPATLTLKFLLRRSIRIRLHSQVGISSVLSCFIQRWKRKPLSFKHHNGMTISSAKTTAPSHHPLALSLAASSSCLGNSNRRRCL